MCDDGGRFFPLHFFIAYMIHTYVAGAGWGITTGNANREQIANWLRCRRQSLGKHFAIRCIIVYKRWLHQSNAYSYNAWCLRSCIPAKYRKVSNAKYIQKSENGRNYNKQQEVPLSVDRESTLVERERFLVHERASAVGLSHIPKRVPYPVKISKTYDKIV